MGAVASQGETVPCGIFYSRSQHQYSSLNHTPREAYTEAQSTGFPGPAKSFFRILCLHLLGYLQGQEAQCLPDNNKAGPSLGIHTQGQGDRGWVRGLGEGLTELEDEEREGAQSAPVPTPTHQPA